MFFSSSPFQKSNKSERGSIMLEVIAVLALMGVMGAMLFRQISQRNQELHNIQMASEIRTVKEAFSAYIQAERADLLIDCPEAEFDPQQCSIDSDDLAGDLNKGVKSYLPEGWFHDGLANYYTFSLWILKQNEATQKTILYGIVVPTDLTVPQTSWNFKRAARVALLIGADGGVYQESMTDDVAGSLGTWHLDPNDIPGLMDDDYPVYLAVTGMDIFVPEYELPEGKTAFKTDLELGADKLHAWKSFAAGGDPANRTNCFTVYHNQARGEPPEVKNDDLSNSNLTSSCHPLFYVNGETKQVFVNNDLEVGKDGTAAVTVTQEGVIKQANTKGITIDADGRVITNKELKAAADNGEIYKDERYVLDPAYTSTMNDIRLSSRGGVRLSDILPRYVLKSTQTVSCPITKGNKECESAVITPLTDCPEGYRVDYLITPTQYAMTAKEDKPETEQHVLTNNDGSISTVNVKEEPSSDVKTVVLYDSNEIKAEKVKSSKSFVQELSGNTLTLTFTTGRIKFTYSQAIAHNQTMEARVDGYCIYDVASGSVKSNERYQTEQTCCEAGLTWKTDGKIGTGTGRCVNIYPTCNIISNGTNSSGNCSARTITDKAAVCKAAGCIWDGTTCS